MKEGFDRTCNTAHCIFDSAYHASDTIDNPLDHILAPLKSLSGNALDKVEGGSKSIHNRIFDISDCGGNGSPDVGENRGHRGMDCSNDRGNRCLNGVEDICDSSLYRIHYC